MDGEIIDELAGGGQSLGADAGAAGEEVGELEVGEEPLEGFEEGLLGEGAVDFAEAGSWEPVNQLTRDVYTVRPV